MNPMALLGDDYQRRVRRAHDNLHDITASPDPSLGVRPSILESWARSVSHLRDPAAVRTRVRYQSDELAEVRRSHPFHTVMPLLRSRLIEPAVDAGMLVALGDAEGCLLWIEGERTVRNRAEAMGFLPGTDWSEDTMGTSAPGLALRSGAPVQISRAEHFAAEVHSWSCSAVPVTDPTTGEVLGIIDVTGGDDAVSSLVMPLLAATARAAGESLSRIGNSEPGRGLRRTAAPRPASAAVPASATRLQVMGAMPSLTDADGTRLILTNRHAEILLLLELHPHGITGGGLVEQLWSAGGSEVTVRAELARLRRAISTMPSVGVEARPYRIRGRLDSDLTRTRRALELGDIDTALELCRGSVLPGTEAPGILQVRAEIEALLRQTLLEHGTWQQLWRYTSLDIARDDAEALMTLLRLAPAEAPERNAVVVRLEALGR